jgi:hypothetical protein
MDEQIENKQKTGKGKEGKTCFYLTVEFEFALVLCWSLPVHVYE